jgi:Protein of unknown function (DUF1778)
MARPGRFVGNAGQRVDDGREADDETQTSLSDQVVFHLEETKFDQFVELLNAPLAPNPGMARLMAVTPPWLPGSTKKG